MTWGASSARRKAERREPWSPITPLLSCWPFKPNELSEGGWEALGPCQGKEASMAVSGSLTLSIKHDLGQASV